MPRPSHPLPYVRDDRETPLRVGRDGERYADDLGMMASNFFGNSEIDQSAVPRRLTFITASPNVRSISEWDINMMRTIQVSTDVFAAIWARRGDTEHSEDEILSRLLAVKKTNAQPSAARDLQTQIGFHDPRYGVKIPHGFEIYRTYKGKEYRAQAIQGFWFWNGTGYPSLNELSSAIGISHENAWVSWFYDQKGRRYPVSKLRDADKIIRRGRPPSVNDL